MDFNLIAAGIDFTPIITNVLLAVVTVVIGAIGKAARDFTVANKNNKQFALVTSIIEQGVQFAEQVYSSADGQEKKDAALDYIQRELDKQGIKVNVDLISDSIEAAVLREFNYGTTVEPQPAEAVAVTEPSSPSESLT